LSAAGRPSSAFVGIGAVDGRLLARITGRPDLPVYTESPVFASTPIRFFYRDIEAELVFDLPEMVERAPRVTLLKDDQRMVFTRRETKGVSSD